MSQELSTARRNLTQINSLLRQGKLLPAAQSLHSALMLIAGRPLMKTEREELDRLFDDAIRRLNADPYLRKLYPLSLNYVPGAEKLFADEVVELLNVLQEATMAEAEEAAQALAEKKAKVLAEGQSKLDAGEHNAARAVFSALSGEHPDDSDLKADIGERVMKAGLYEDAAAYLSEAVAIDPHALQYYNRLGMALRKLGRFDAAEDFYLKAFDIAPENTSLLFNIGRLYLEWERWDKAVELGEKAAALQPDFIEARKLADFARKKMG